MSTIAQQLQELAQIKEEIRQAIINKGVTVSSDAAFSTYATAIAQISGGGGGETLNALIDRSIRSITIPSGITTIGSFAFCNCTSLNSVTIPSGITTIGNSTFENSRLTSVVIPNSVTSLGISCFKTCSLTSISLSENLTSMGASCFQGCGNLASIDIPIGVTSLGSLFFSSCFLLATIICHSTTPPTAADNAFGSAASYYVGKNVAGSKTLYVPHGCSSAYQSATGGWATLLDSTKCGFSIVELNPDGTKPNS